MLGAMTCAFVRVCLVPAPGNLARIDTSRATALRERLRCVVRQNMNSPDFGQEALRRLVAMSRSKLYRIFEGNGGVVRFIQDECLHAAKQRLADIKDKTSIRALAGEVGFLEHSTFSRAFKLRYGSSPTEFREMVSAHHPLDQRDDQHDADSISRPCEEPACHLPNPDQGVSRISLNWMRKPKTEIFDRHIAPRPAPLERQKKQGLLFGMIH